MTPLDGTGPPRRMFELASASALATTGGPEHIVDLVWVPDRSRLVAVMRQTGPPARARVVLLNVTAPEAVDRRQRVGDRALAMLARR
jgi:hypothetical protein